MAFFDDISKKISQTGQSAVQKTKDMADIAKINAAISEEQKKINNAYVQIGKLYVSKHASDYEDDFAGMVNTIKDSENKIVDYQRQIQDIKGVVCCEKCGAEIPSNSAFCSSCGAPLPKREVVEEDTNDTDFVKCIGCGQMVSREIKFCTSCGKSVMESMQAQSVQDTAEGIEDTH